MNNKRRAAVREAVRILNTVSDSLMSIADEEQDALDNIPANLECGELYERLSENVSLLEAAADNISDAADSISDL